ncbi:hypothetical protein Vretimale_10384, partial [Volvox reticuliferus]
GGFSRNSYRRIERVFSGSSGSHVVEPAPLASPKPSATTTSRISPLSSARSFQAPCTSSPSVGSGLSVLPPPQQQEPQQRHLAHDGMVGKRASSLGALTVAKVLAGANPMRRLLRIQQAAVRSCKTLSLAQVTSGGPRGSMQINPPSSYSNGHPSPRSQSAASPAAVAITLEPPPSPLLLKESAAKALAPIQLCVGGSGPGVMTQLEVFPLPQTQSLPQRLHPSLEDSGPSHQQRLLQLQRPRGYSLGSRPLQLTANRSRLSLLGAIDDSDASPIGCSGGGGGAAATAALETAAGASRCRPQSALLGMAAAGPGAPQVSNASIDSGAMRAMLVVDSALYSGSGLEAPAQGDPLATSTFNIALPPSMLPRQPRRNLPKRCASACDLTRGLRGNAPVPVTMTSTSRAVAFASTLRNAPMTSQLYCTGGGGNSGATATATGTGTVQSLASNATSTAAAVAPSGQQQLTPAPVVRSGCSGGGRVVSPAIGSTSRLAAVGGGGMTAYPMPSRAITIQGYGVLRTNHTAHSVLRRNFGSPSTTGTSSAVLPLAATRTSVDAVMPSAPLPPAAELSSGTNSGLERIRAVWQASPLRGMDSTATQIHTPSHGQPRMHINGQTSTSTVVADCIDPLAGFSNLPMYESTVLSPFCTATATSGAAEVAAVGDADVCLDATGTTGVCDGVRGGGPAMSPTRRQGRRNAAALVSDPEGVPYGEVGDALGAITFLTASDNTYCNTVATLHAAVTEQAVPLAFRQPATKLMPSASAPTPMPSVGKYDTLGSTEGPDHRLPRSPGRVDGRFVPDGLDSENKAQAGHVGQRSGPSPFVAEWYERHVARHGAMVNGISDGVAHAAASNGGDAAATAKSGCDTVLASEAPTRRSSSNHESERQSPAVAAAVAAAVTVPPPRGPGTLLPNLLCSNLSTVRETHSAAVSEVTEGHNLEYMAAAAATVTSAAGRSGSSSHRASEPVRTTATAATGVATAVDAEGGSSDAGPSVFTVDAGSNEGADCRKKVDDPDAAAAATAATAAAAAGAVASPPPPLTPPPMPGLPQPLQAMVQPPESTPMSTTALLGANAHTAALLTALETDAHPDSLPTPTTDGSGGGGGASGGGGGGGGGSGDGWFGASDQSPTDMASAQVNKAPISSRDALPETWHEVWASRAIDPITGEAVLVLAQHDVTAKVIAERHLALVMETEHRLLEQLFPRHILAYITEEWTCEALRAAIAPPRTDGSPLHPANGQFSRPTVRDCTALATWHEQVTLLFADIKGFTPMCKQVEPRAVMSMLNDLYSRYDKMLDKYGVFKVETIGDCYFVAGGLMHEDEDGMVAVRGEGTRQDPLHARKVFMFAKAMLEAARQVAMPTTGEPVQIRIGIATGPVVSGVVGQRMPRFCLFGDTVNTASRMESTGSPGCIHVSQSTYELLRDEAWVPTGGIEVKGKGLMQTYLWQGSLELAPGVHPDLPEALEAAVAAAAPGLRSMTIGKTPSHTVQKIAQVSSSVAQLQDLLMGSVAGRTAVTGVSAGTGNCVVPAVSGLTTSGISDQGLALAIAEGLLQRVTAGLGGASTCSDHQTVSCVGHGAIDPADADVADCNSRHHVR